VAWFPTAWQYLTSLVNWITARANDISGWAATASAAAAAAFATANASMWTSGATYAVGVNVIDPVDMLTYRRKTAGAGTTRPGQDTSNWTLLTGQGDVLLTAPQTLSNKTLTNPVINGFTGGTQVINIGSGQFYKDALGNVGLGTSLPTARLDINTPAGTAAVLKLYTESNEAASRLQFGQIGAIEWDIGISAAEGHFQIGLSGGGLAYKINRNGAEILSHSWFTAGSKRMAIDTSGNLIQTAPPTPPSLDTNGTLVLNLTSNTNLRVSARGDDGVTRTANFTLS
jgi:hypothetical protein